MEKEVITTRCCISGGGPAGIMLGYLLARAGVDVVVLEKWPDFFRDFRGDTIHPSTMTVLKEIGLLEQFLALPHEKTYQLGARIEGKDIVIADFSRTKMKTPFIAFIPQWDFLNFLADNARRYPSFHLHMETEAKDIIEEGGCVVGVRATHKGKEVEIRAELVVGADGRHSTLREKAGMIAHAYGAPMDALWFKISRKAADPKQTLGIVERGRIMVTIERGEYWQCAYVIPKGDFEEIKKQGLEAFLNGIVELVPIFADRAAEITSWEKVKFLGVTVDRLEEWAREGLVCIGDAAHAMSPIGGVGINIAVQDAVAAANILAPAFRRGMPRLSDLHAIQKRRMLAVRVTQGLQLLLQRRIIARVLSGEIQPRVPFLFRILQRYPSLQKIPAYLIGVGVRPEHVSSTILS